MGWLQDLSSDFSLHHISDILHDPHKAAEGWFTKGAQSHIGPAALNFVPYVGPLLSAGATQWLNHEKRKGVYGGKTGQIPIQSSAASYAPEAAGLAAKYGVSAFGGSKGNIPPTLKDSSGNDQNSGDPSVGAQLLARPGSLAAMAQASQQAPTAGNANAVSTSHLYPGVIEEGHRYKGGDPADQNNWEKVDG